MIAPALDRLPDLYEQDETAWLETMAELIRDGRADELDYTNLSEYLDDMAKRDKREVESRLVVYMAHVLKWTYQPRKRSRSWRVTTEVQREQLARDVASGVLRNHAKDVIPMLYPAAVRQASYETGLPESKFPRECPFTLEQLEALDVLAE